MSKQIGTIDAMGATASAFLSVFLGHWKNHRNDGGPMKGCFGIPRPGGKLVLALGQSAFAVPRPSHDPDTAGRNPFACLSSQGPALMAVAILIASIGTFGPAGAEQAANRVCAPTSETDTESHMSCDRFLEGYQAAKRWHCKTSDWSDYLINDIPPEFHVEMGGIVLVIELTSSAFCDKGIPDN